LDHCHTLAPPGTSGNTARGAKIKNSDRSICRRGRSTYFVSVAQAACQFQSNPSPEARKSVRECGKLEPRNSGHYRIGDRHDRRRPVRLGINNRHFAHVLAGTSAGDHPSIDDNRERSAQYQKEISVRRILRYEDSTGGYCLEGDPPRQLSRQIFITNDGLRAERFNQTQLSVSALESVK
jgi:hypothetical protein